MNATHTVEGFLAVELFPEVLLAENGHLITRLSATKWGGWEGLEILEYEGAGTVDVTAEHLAQAKQVRDGL